MNQCQMSSAERMSRWISKGEYQAKDLRRSEEINEIDDTRRDAKSKLERGTNLVVVEQACFKSSSPLTAHDGLP